MIALPDFYSCRLIHSVRKPHVCCETGTQILPGMPAAVHAGKWDGEFRSFYMHRAVHSLMLDVQWGMRREKIDPEDGPPFTGLLDWIRESRDEGLRQKWNGLASVFGAKTIEPRQEPQKDGTWTPGNTYDRPPGQKPQSVT